MVRHDPARSGAMLLDPVRVRPGVPRSHVVRFERCGADRVWRCGSSVAVQFERRRADRAWRCGSGVAVQFERRRADRGVVVVG
jgi:hypothetical protein